MGLTFYSNGYYWVFYFDGTNYGFRTSTTGSSWSSETTIATSCSVSAGTMSFYLSGSTVYRACWNGGDFYVDTGILGSGTISWGTETGIAAKQSTASPSSISTTVDSSGNWWVSFGSQSGTSEYIEVWTCASSCLTSTNWSSSEDLSDGTTNGWSTQVLSLTSGKLALVAGNPNGESYLQVQTYSGSAWSGSGLVDSANTDYQWMGSCATISDTVYCVTADDVGDGLMFLSVAYSTSPSWSSESEISSQCSGVGQPWSSIASDGSSHLGVYFLCQGSTSTYYMTSSNSGSSWSSLVTDSNGGETSASRVSCSFATDANGDMQCVWTSGSSSPYNVRFADVTVFTLSDVPSVAQTKNCAVTTAATSGTCAFASNVPTGDIVAVGVVTSSSADTVSTVTDSASNTYAKVASVATQSISDAELWKSCITTAGTLTVTVTVSASSTFDIILYDVSSSHCRTMLSSTGTSTGATASAVTSYSPPKNSMIIGVLGSACVSTCAVTAGSGYTLDNNVAVGSTQASSESKLEASTSETTPLSMNASSAYNEVSMQVPPTEFSNTFKASYPDGSPSTGAPAFCLQNGVLATLGDLTTAGVSGYCDYGSVAYAQAFAPGGSSTQQYSAIPLTQGLVGSWLTGLPSSLAGSTCTGATVYDLSHNNDTATCYNSPSIVSEGSSGAVQFSSDSSQYIGSSNPATASSNGYFALWWKNDGNSIGAGSPAWGVISSHTAGINSGYAVFFVHPSGSTNMQLQQFAGSGCSNVNLYLNGTLATENSGTILYEPVSSFGSKSYVTFTWVGCSDTTGYSPYNWLLGGYEWISFSGGGSSPHLFSNSTIWDFTTGSYALSASEAAELYAQTSQQTMQHQITSPSNTYTFDYYHQYAEAPYYTAISATPSGNALNYYYSSLGQSLTDTMGTSSATIWADATTVTVGDHYVSSGERYSSNANTTLSAADTSGPDVSVYHQYAATSSYSGTVATGGAPSLACQRYGSPSSDALTTTASVKWVDSGCAFSITKPSADFPSTGTRYETNYANGTISAATTIDPAFYQQFYVTPGTGISKLTGTEFGSPMTYTAPGWLDSGTSVTSDGTASCAFTVSGPSWDYQFGGSTLQAWLNTTGSSFGDYTSSSHPYVTFDAAHVSATVCVPSSSGLSVTGVTDDGSPVAYSWVSPLVTFKGDSVFEVQLSGSGSSSPSGSPPSSGSPSGSSPLPPPSTVVSAAPDYLGYGLVLIAAIIVGVLALQRFEQGPLYSVARKKGKGLARGVKRRRTLRLGRKED